MNQKKVLENYFDKYSSIIKNLEKRKIETLIKKLKFFKKKILIFGNGGSANIANHVANDFTNASKIRALAFNDSGMITCFSNDYGFENWICKAIDYYSDKGDIVILISSSGMSKNIIKAAKKCKLENIFLVTLSGFKENNLLRNYGNINFYVPSVSYNYVELVHLQILMSAIDLLKKN
jgi:D-sedoheptulose 7-phosphate isomerase